MKILTTTWSRLRLFCFLGARKAKHVCGGNGPCGMRVAQNAPRWRGSYRSALSRAPRCPRWRKPRSSPISRAAKSPATAFRRGWRAPAGVSMRAPLRSPGVPGAMTVANGIPGHPQSRTKSQTCHDHFCTPRSRRSGAWPGATQCVLAACKILAAYTARSAPPVSPAETQTQQRAREDPRNN